MPTKLCLLPSAAAQDPAPCLGPPSLPGHSGGAPIPQQCGLQPLPCLCSRGWISLLVPHFQLDSPQERLPGGFPMAPSPRSPPQAGAGMKLLWGRCRAGVCSWLWLCKAKAGDVSQGPWDIPASPGVWAGFYGIRSPCPACLGLALWNTFLIKPGNEEGAWVVPAGMGLLCPGARGSRDGVSIIPSSWLIPQRCWQPARPGRSHLPLLPCITLSPFCTWITPWLPGVLVLHSISLHPASPCPACSCYGLAGTESPR